MSIVPVGYILPSVEDPTLVIFAFHKQDFKLEGSIRENNILQLHSLCLLPLILFGHYSTTQSTQTFTD